MLRQSRGSTINARSLCVLSRFGSALSLFSLLVVFCVLDAVFVFFSFGSNGFYARRCFVHLEMYSHCRWVPAMRGQSFCDVQDARGCAINLHFITNSGSIPGGQNLGSERQTVFFTAVNPMDKEHKDPYKLDLTKPRLASYKQKTWKRLQDTVYWVDIQLAQRKGLKFYQARSKSFILHETLPAYCISKVVVMNSEEIIYQKVYVSPRPPPKISYKDHWRNKLASEVAGSSKDTQIQPKPKTQLSRTLRPVGGQESTKEIEKGTLFDHEDVKHSTRTGRPVSQFTEQVTCREHTLPRDEKSTDPKGWIRGNTKIGPILEVTTSYLQGKHGVHI